MVFDGYIAENKNHLCRLVNFSEKSIKLPQNPISFYRRRACVLDTTVSVTGFSVTLTVISLAQTVADILCFAPFARRFASIFRAEAVHVVGSKTHVVCRVCKARCLLFHSWPSCWRGFVGIWLRRGYFRLLRMTALARSTAEVSRLAR